MISIGGMANQAVFYDRLGAFDEFTEKLGESGSQEETASLFNSLSQLLEEEDAAFLRLNADSRADHLSGKFVTVLRNQEAIFEQAESLLLSRTPAHKIASLRFLLAASLCSDSDRIYALDR